MTDTILVVRILVVLLLIALAVILTTKRLSVPYTLGLVIVGLLISIFNLLPAIRLTPTLVLFVFLAALLFGSYGRSIGMSEQTRETIDNFWNVIAFLANALLFLLVGVELNPVRFFTTQSIASFLLIAGITIVAVLLARFVMVLALPRHAPPARGKLLPSWRFIIFWSGLRGALSLALVLALPFDIPNLEPLIFSTYAVVLFTLLVQGFSLRLILKRLPLT